MRDATTWAASDGGKLRIGRNACEAVVKCSTARNPNNIPTPHVRVATYEIVKWTNYLIQFRFIPRLKRTSVKVCISPSDNTTEQAVGISDTRIDRRKIFILNCKFEVTKRTVTVEVAAFFGDPNSKVFVVGKFLELWKKKHTPLFWTQISQIHISTTVT
jgi:hypothetical protein